MRNPPDARHDERVPPAAEASRMCSRPAAGPIECETDHVLGLLQESSAYSAYATAQSLLLTTDPIARIGVARTAPTAQTGSLSGSGSNLVNAAPRWRREPPLPRRAGPG